MAHTLTHLAKVLKANPFPTDLNALTKEAEKESDPEPEEGEE
jgi:hypothetical protein